MARVNITITLEYEIHKVAKELGLNISRVCDKALEREIKKRKV